MAKVAQLLPATRKATIAGSTWKDMAMECSLTRCSNTVVADDTRTRACRSIGLHTENFSEHYKVFSHITYFCSMFTPLNRPSG